MKVMDKKTGSTHLSLLKKTANGDTKAFETLYEMTSQGIYFYLFRMLQNKESAEEIRTDVFTQVWKNASRFQGKSKVTTWMFGIARNLALNELRRNKPVVMGELTETIEDQSSSNGYISFENAQMVQKALKDLPVKQREVMDLIFFHELNYKEVGEILDIPENTVKTRVFYAKSALKERLLILRGDTNDNDE